jgi:hypothetical protein
MDCGNLETKAPHKKQSTRSTPRQWQDLEKINKAQKSKKEKQDNTYLHSKYYIIWERSHNRANDENDRRTQIYARSSPCGVVRPQSCARDRGMLLYEHAYSTVMYTVCRTASVVGRRTVGSIERTMIALPVFPRVRGCGKADAKQRGQNRALLQ